MAIIGAGYVGRTLGIAWRARKFGTNFGFGVLRGRS
jgi:hypothetical protein